MPFLFASASPGLLALQGSVAVLVGVLALAWPELLLRALAAAFGLGCLVLGSMLLGLAWQAWRAPVRAGPRITVLRGGFDPGSPWGLRYRFWA